MKKFFKKEGVELDDLVSLKGRYIAENFLKEDEVRQNSKELADWIEVQLSAMVITMT